MYLEAYKLLRDIFTSQELSDFFREKTGKTLTLIDAGPVVDSPSVRIDFGSSSTGQLHDRNTGRSVSYRVTFDIPLWSHDSMRVAHEILDKVMTFVGCKNSNDECRAIIKTISPVMLEPAPESKLWSLVVDVTILFFI